MIGTTAFFHLLLELDVGDLKLILVLLTIACSMAQIVFDGSL